MKKVLACVQGATYDTCVGDYAVWAAQQLGVSLEFLHVLDRHPERPTVVDLSGNLALGAQETLLAELAALDEQRSGLAQRQGRALLDAALSRAKSRWPGVVEGRQRHGQRVESLLDLQAETRLLVLGQHQPSVQQPRPFLDSDVERVIRAVQRPALVVSAPFKTPQHFALAFDGSATGCNMVETVATSPLLRGQTCTLVMAGLDSADAARQLDWAETTLAAAGFAVIIHTIAEGLEAVLPGYLASCGADLLVMGAYGHSRIREFIVGSTTTALLRTAPVPVLILR